MKYIKGFTYSIIFILILNLITSTLYYSNFIDYNLNNYLNLFITAISILIGGIYIGSKSNKKGYLEGIKYGLVIIFIIFILSLLVNTFNIKNIIYYLILLVSSIIGSMIGINKKKASN